MSTSRRLGALGIERRIKMTIPGWEEITDEESAIWDEAQIVDGHWFIPKWGCDSLQRTVDYYNDLLETRGELR